MTPVTMDRDYVKSKIRQLIAKDWYTDDELTNIYTILLALPLSGGNLSQMLDELCNMINHDMDQLIVNQKETA